mmetsp:Transcript_47625/g.146768  ORF Transcript_47625/g.146768 Transcript_47625/m.146768 type:complete len:274 (-) Transcript_47625:160-981(-)
MHACARAGGRARASLLVGCPAIDEYLAAHEVALAQHGDGLLHLCVRGEAHAADALRLAVLGAVLRQDVAELNGARLLHVVLQVLPSDLVRQVPDVHEVLAGDFDPLAAALATSLAAHEGAASLALAAWPAIPAHGVPGKLQVLAHGAYPVSGPGLLAARGGGRGDGGGRLVRQHEGGGAPLLLLLLPLAGAACPGVHYKGAAVELDPIEARDGELHLGLRLEPDNAYAAGPAPLRAVLCEDAGVLHLPDLLEVVLQLLPLALEGEVADVNRAR